MLLLPGALIGLIVLHIYLVTRLGVASPPWSPTGAGREPRAPEPEGREGLIRPPENGGGRVVASKRLAGGARRASRSTRRTSAKEGKGFFPYAIFHDTVMSLVVVCVIVALACVWYFTAGERRGRRTVLLGPLVQAKADPGTTNFIPRPDWFFYFLFYLLRIFKWPNTVVLGTVGVPTIALILLIGLPFYDRGRERHPLRRPVAMIAGCSSSSRWASSRGRARPPRRRSAAS